MPGGCLGVPKLAAVVPLGPGQHHHHLQQYCNGSSASHHCSTFAAAFILPRVASAPTWGDPALQL